MVDSSSTFSSGDRESVNKETLTDSQKHFITFLVQNKVLLFGDFVTKSGRRTPFFLNFGLVFEGRQIQELGKLYANWIIQEFGRQSFVIFGPAYKGIPLAVATVMGLADLGCPASYFFNRKEAKTHGETGMYVGKMPSAGDVVIIVDDVVTAGLTLREIVPQVIKLADDATFAGVVVGVDRNERGQIAAARIEAEKAFNTRIRPIVSMREVIDYLSKPNASGRQLSDDEVSACRGYMTEFGVGEEG